MTRSAEHQAILDRMSQEAETDGRGVLEAMCREAGPAYWRQRPLECLEMYAEARSFMEQEVAELVDLLRQGNEPPVSWEEIASRLSMSRQAAWTKYRTSSPTTTRMRQRPGPRTQQDSIEFTFTANRSFLKPGASSPITIPTSFNDVLNDRLPGEGPSWPLVVTTARGSEPGRLRQGRRGGNEYFQLNFSSKDRERILPTTPLGTVLRVQILLLGALRANLAHAS